MKDALAAIDLILSYDDACAVAYNLRSQLLSLSLSITDDHFLASLTSSNSALRDEESKKCLQQLIPTSSSLLPLDSQDMRLHEAAEDALLSFLLGGSSDLALATAAEEAARETCRKFAKSAYSEKLLAVTLDDKKVVARPRNWLLQSYYSGYDLLSKAFDLYGEATFPSFASQASDVNEADGSDEIDETTPEERARSSLPPPPDHLTEGAVVTDKDREAYHLLCLLSNKIETALFQHPSLSSASHLTPEMKELFNQTGLEVLGEELGDVGELKVFEQIPFTTSEELLEDDVIAFEEVKEDGAVPHFKSSSSWKIVDFGQIESYELPEKNKILPLTSSSTNGSANATQTGGSAITDTLEEEETVTQLTALYSELSALLRTSSD